MPCYVLVKKPMLMKRTEKNNTDQHYIKTSEELKKLYEDIPESLENNYNFSIKI